MQYQEHRPAFFIRKGKELPLSGGALVELLKAVLAKGASFRFRAKGFSMAPFIKDGDVVTVSSLKNALPRAGDVVAFINSKTDKLVIHRIVKQINNGYFIMGDNTLKADGLIPREDILGRLTKVERNEKEIFWGLGAERFLIAWLNRKKVLPSFFSIWRLIPPFLRRRLV